MAATEHESYLKLKTDTLYFALTGELWVSVVTKLEKIDRVVIALYSLPLYLHYPHVTAYNGFVHIDASW